MSSRVLACTVLMASVASAQPTAPAPPSEATTVETVETVETTTAETLTTEAQVTPTAPAVGPTVGALEVAADNPDAAPVISLTIDRAVGAGVATVWWRASGTTAVGADGGGPTWTKMAMAGGPSGLKLARLPDGVQRAGFSFYVEATDDRGGLTTFGSRAAPITVEPAVEGNADRLRNDARDENAIVGPHPAFVMIALSAGVLAGAGAGIFAYDLSIVNGQLADVDAELADNPSASRRAALEASRASFADAALQDTTAAVLLGVVAGVALVTGTTLLVVGAVEQ